MLFDTRLWQFTRGVRLRIAATVAMGILSSLVGIGRLGLLGWLLARVFAGDTFADLIAPLSAVAAVMVLRGWIEYTRAMVAHRTAIRVQLALRKQLYDKVVALGPAHFGLERTGAVMISMIDGVEQLETYFGQYLPQLLVSVITPLVVFALLAFYDLPVAAVMFAFAMFTLFVPVSFQRFEAKSSMRRSQAYRAFAAEFLDAIQGLATLKAFGQSTARGRLLAKRAHEVFQSTMWVLATNAGNRGLTDLGVAVGTAAVLALGAWRVSQGEMSLEVLLVVLMMGIEVFRPQRDLRALLHNGMMSRAAAADIFALLDARPRVEPPSMPVDLDGPITPVVAFDDVSFSYPGGRRAAHRGLSFQVDAGERVGFVGESGAGKSTIVRLLLRFYDPDAGVVRIGGHDLRDLGTDDVYPNVAVVNQDTYLFHGTVEDNVRFGKPDARDRGHRGGRTRGECARVHHATAARLRHGRWRARHQALRRSAPTRRDRPRAAPRRAHPDTRRGTLRGGRGERGGHPVRPRPAHAGPHHAHLRAPVVERDRRGPHYGPRPGGDRGGWRPRHADALAGDVLPTHGSPGRREYATRPIPGLCRRACGFRGGPPRGRPDRRRPRPRRTHRCDPARRRHGLDRRLPRTAAPRRAVEGEVLARPGVGDRAGGVADRRGDVASALAVAAVKRGEPFAPYLGVLAIVAPLSGVLHWLESWFAHDMAFRMLAEMRISLYEKLDRLAPAYLVRRRTGDLVGMATHDVELVEYFFAHTVAPFLVAVLVPAAVVGTLAWFGWPMALALAPFLAVVAISPVLARRRIDMLGSRAREAFGDMNAHAVDTIQGLGEILAFQRTKARGADFVARIERHTALRLPFYADLTRQTAILEAVTGLGGLVVVATGTHLVGTGALDPAILPMLTLLAMAAFLPVSEIAHIGRQLADTLGATRRLYAVHNEVEAVTDGPGVGAPARSGGVEIDVRDVGFSYLGNRRLALDGATFTVPAGKTLALVGPSGAGKTTAAHLLMRFWDPGSGVIRFDGHDLREYRLDELRDRVALVTQDTYLFNETLRANILIAKPDATARKSMRRCTGPPSARSWTPFRTASTPLSASGAFGFPAASGNVSRSRGHS